MMYVTVSNWGFCDAAKSSSSPLETALYTVLVISGSCIYEGGLSDLYF